jgi:hypothetical protein
MWLGKIVPMLTANNPNPIMEIGRYSFHSPLTPFCAGCQIPTVLVTRQKIGLVEKKDK